MEGKHTDGVKAEDEVDGTRIVEKKKREEVDGQRLRYAAGRRGTARGRKHYLLRNSHVFDREAAPRVFPGFPCFVRLRFPPTDHS